MPAGARYLYIGAAIIATCMFIVFPWWTVDDAYIAFRYGKNLAETGNLVWNVGMDPVEGYTGIVLPILAALFTRIGISPAGGMHIVGILAWLGTAVGLIFLLRKMGVSQLISSIAAMLFVLQPYMYTHALSGLETSLYMFSLTLLAVALAAVIKQGTSVRKEIYLALAALFIALVRPEGWVIGPIATAVCLIYLWQNERARIGRGLVLGVLFFAAPFTLYMCWRVQYFGSWLPNTWYAKRYSGFWNFETVYDAIKFTSIYVGIPILLLSIFFILIKTSSMAIQIPENKYIKSNKYIAYFIVFSLISVLLGYRKSELFMNYSHRFFTPFIPYIIALLSIVYIYINNSFIKVSETKLVIIKPLKLIILLCVTAHLFIFGWKLKYELWFTGYYQSIMEEEYKEVAKSLNEHLSPGSRLICYMDAGAIPYYSNLKAFDFGKLNDAFLAQKSPDRQSVIEYFYQIDAEAVVFTSWSPDRVNYIEEAEVIISDPRFEKYRLFRIFSNSSGFPYYQFVYFKEDKVTSGLYKQNKQQTGG